MQTPEGSLATETCATVLRHRLTSAAGVPLTYQEYRPLGEPRSDIVLVHGLASAGSQFHADALHFANRGYRVLVPDLRGHGASGVPVGPIVRAAFSIPVLADDVIAMLDHAGAADVHWVGNSLGGILALWLLGTPLASRLSSLVVFGTCFSMRLPAATEQLLRLSFLPGATVTAWLTARTTTASPGGRNIVQAAIKAFHVDAGAAIVSHVRTYDFVANALSYDKPLLVLRGGLDHAVDLGLRRDLGKFTDQPNFHQIDLPKGGHCANLDVPELFRTALETHWAAV